jgi:hypothetical protein
VTVTVEPPDAHIIQGDKDLGSNMATIQVEEGSAVEIEVRRKGYVTKKVLLDGTNADERVRLEKEGGRPPQVKHSGGSKTPPVGSGSAKPKRPGDEVVVPWK